MIPLGDNVKKLGYGFIIWLIILANIVVTFRIFNLPIWDYFSFLKNYSFNSSESLSVGNFIKRAVASMHMHGSLSHLWLNMWFLFVFGVSVEEAVGPWGFALLYYASGLAGWFLYYLLTLQNLPAMGSSGAVSGVMACYLVLFPRARIQSFWLLFFTVRLIYVPCWLYIGAWAIYQFMSLSGNNTSIAYEAHAGGIIFGILFGLAYKFLNGGKPVYVKPEDSD